MGYVIVGMLCFIGGFIVNYMMKRNEKKGIVLKEVEVKEIAKKEAEKELEKIKVKLGKGTKEKDRDEIIKDIDDYFSKYGNPYDRDSE